MKILICNAGSTSLKFKLWQMPEFENMAEGRVERVGSENAIFSYVSAKGKIYEENLHIPDRGISMRKAESQRIFVPFISCFLQRIGSGLSIPYQRIRFRIALEHAPISIAIQHTFTTPARSSSIARGIQITAKGRTFQLS